MRSAGFRLAFAAFLLLTPAAARAGAVPHAVPDRDWAANVVIPQSRVMRAQPGTPVQVTRVKAKVTILEQAATTTLDIMLSNPTARRQEAELLVPVPAGAAIRGFTFQGGGAEPSAQLLPREEAARTYQQIVARIRDPALLEFAGLNLVRSSVFPVEPNGTQQLRLTYEHLLPAEGDRLDYVLPRSEAVDYQVPWTIEVEIRTRQPLSTVYSPSHAIAVTRQDPGRLTVVLAPGAGTEPGPFQLSALKQGPEGISASLIAYPDPAEGGGYFLLLAGLPAAEQLAKGQAAAPAIKREVTLVLDRSGSMAGEKLEQARAAALQIVSGLQPGEFFNIIDYSDSLNRFAPAAVARTAESLAAAEAYLRALSANGGTNIHDALLEALRPDPAADTLPLVLFLTDGLPTIGQRDEATIRLAAQKGNPHGRRIFTFGVGHDVNAPLLTGLAEESRAVSTFVQPGEDVELKVAQVYRRLSGPVLADPALAVTDIAGAEDTRRVSELLPGRLPDFYAGDQLVLLGRYQGEGPLNFRLKGNYRGRQRTFRFSFNLDRATTRNAFVPRLWASRKIARLVDEIRDAGAVAGLDPATAAARAAGDPRLRELVDEIVRLSLKYGILTEYTAFLAREGTDLTRPEALQTAARNNFVERAIGTRDGGGAVNQELNNNFQRRQQVGNRRNEFYDRNMNRVQVAEVQQVNDRAFFRQGDRWVDGEALNAPGAARPDRVVAAGTPEFRELLERLVRENRQGTLSLSGEVMLRLDGRNVLVRDR